MSLFDSSNKGVKFDTIGASITGTVKSAPRERQQTNFTTKQPDFWPNGDPKMQVLVDLQTDQRVDANDDGERTLYVASKNMKRAVSDAIREAGAPDLLPGGVLTVQYIGNDPASKNPQNPAKMYTAQYTAPTSAFVQQPAAAAPMQQAPAQQFVPQPAPQQAYVPQPAPQQYVPQAPPAAVPSAPQPVQQQAPFTPAPAPAQGHGGLTAEQIAQLQQLRAAQIPEATIATALGITPAQLTTFDNTPF
jgi:hypothetical protein